MAKATNGVYYLLRAKAAKGRSAWERGVAIYAFELFDELQAVAPEREFEHYTELKKLLLNGADSWQQYSEGGCSLISDCEIAQRLCTPSELKRTKNGERNPNSEESWPDVQARALTQAASMLWQLMRARS